MPVSPISPKNVQAERNLSIPDEVLEVFNALIAENWNGRTSKVLQNEAISRIVAVLEIPRQHVFNLGYLDVEDIYRGEGWDVEYDKPGYCETYEAYFVFKRDSPVEDYSSL